MPKPLWFFGDAVQDITVEIDLDRLSREYGYISDSIRLVDQGVEVRQGLWLKTQIGLQKFAVQFDLLDNALSDDQFYLLSPGSKYTLSGQICDSFDDIDGRGLFVPCENISWGGGGINCATFLRAVAPDPAVVPLRYTDVAMSRSLPRLVHEFDGFRNALIKTIPGDYSGNPSLAAYIEGLFDTDPSRAESITSDIASVATQYAADRSLEVYLASLPVEPLLYRPRGAPFRRNWVLSRIRSANREIENKIILRGQYATDTDEAVISKLLAPNSDGVGAVVLNSLKNKPLFQAAYSLYKDAYKKNNDVVGILAMTEGMQSFTDWLISDRLGEDSNEFLPFILVLNEVEAVKLARKFSNDNDVEPFMAGPDDFPDVVKFGKMASVLMKQFSMDFVPRIYVTLGSRGSLGVDGIGPVIYVGSYSRPGATVYDTNACGDAYCATIALLEWAKRNGHANAADVDLSRDPLASAREMIYFMSVATAVAFCKASNRRGKVYSTDVKDLLDHVHIASEMLPNAFVLAKGENLPDSVQDGRLTRPAVAKLISVKKALSSLMSSEKG